MPTAPHQLLTTSNQIGNKMTIHKLTDTTKMTGIDFDSLTEAQAEQLTVFLERCIDNGDGIVLLGLLWEPEHVLESFELAELSEDELEELLELSSYE